MKKPMELISVKAPEGWDACMCYDYDACRYGLSIKRYRDSWWVTIGSFGRLYSDDEIAYKEQLIALATNTVAKYFAMRNAVDSAKNRPKISK